jgi:hypothetical protein
MRRVAFNRRSLCAQGGFPFVDPVEQVLEDALVLGLVEDLVAQSRVAANPRPGNVETSPPRPAVRRIADISSAASDIVSVRKTSGSSR